MVTSHNRRSSGAGNSRAVSGRATCSVSPEKATTERRSSSSEEVRRKVLRVEAAACLREWK